MQSLKARTFVGVDTADADADADADAVSLRSGLCPRDASTLAYGDRGSDTIVWDRGK